MSPEDPRHGSVAGYRAGCHADCCRRANTHYDILRRIDAINGLRRTHDATGTIRRIRALRRIGWTLEHIATDSGVGTFQAVDRIANRRVVTTATRDRIAATFDRLCMTPGPSAKAKAHAIRQGWPPPLAWDDIDDPNERPRGVTDANPRRDLLAEWDHLRTSGESIHQAALQLGVTVDAIEKALERERRVA